MFKNLKRREKKKVLVTFDEKFETYTKYFLCYEEYYKLQLRHASIFIFVS